jgi:hypothetical protein
LKRLAIQHPDAPWTSAGDIEESLLGIGRERNAGGCLAISAEEVRSAGRLAPAIDEGLLQVFSLGGEDLDALSSAVGDVDEAVV